MNAVRPWLHIGKLAETLNRPLLDYCEIGAMLQLCRPVEQEGIISLYLPIEDGVVLSTKTLEVGVEFVREQKKSGRTVLVACGAGISRSATFVVAALKEEEGISLLEALKEVCAAHREAMPHPVLWKSICDYYGEPTPFAEMVKTCRPPKWA